MLSVLRLTADGKSRVPEMLPALAVEFGLTTEDMALMLPSGRTPLVASRAHWARTYLVKAGLVKRTKRGHCEVTQRGRDVLNTNPDRIDNVTLSRFNEFAAWKSRTGEARSPTLDPSDGADSRHNVEAPPPIPPEERIEAAQKELEAALADELLTALLDGSPSFFERAVVDLLVAMGYGRGRDGAGKLLAKSGDGGIDGVINEDALGLDAVYVQAKRYAPENTVGRPAIQQFVGSLTGEGAAKGVFVTTSAFSREALSFVERVAQRIVLIDGQRLARLMIAHGVGVRPVRAITLRQIDENFFADD